ncbi:MAG: HutP family protein [Clostridia bacterium]|nr:HutP family protein [Clostridia bacterium]
MLKADMSTREVARAAIMLAMTQSREEEASMKASFAQMGVKAAAADYGGEFVPSMMKIVERAVVCAKREGIIQDTHHDEGAVAGAAREALSQVATKALGLSVGGKISIARRGDHLVCAVFFGIGLVHLNEVCIGMSHRII